MRNFFSALNLWTESEEDTAQAISIIESSNVLQDQVFSSQEKEISDFQKLDEKQRAALQDSRIISAPREKGKPAETIPLFSVEPAPDPEPIEEPGPV